MRINGRENNKGRKLFFKSELQNSEGVISHGMEGSIGEINDNSNIISNYIPTTANINGNSVAGGGVVDSSGRGVGGDLSVDKVVGG